MHMNRLLYLKSIANKDLLHSTRNSAQRVAAGPEGVWGEWTQVHAWLGPFAVPLKLS